MHYESRDISSTPVYKDDLMYIHINLTNLYGEMIYPLIFNVVNVLSHLI